MRLSLRLVGLLALLALPGCGGGGEDVTVRNLAAARRTWTAAKVRDYDLEWTTSGAQNGHYRVYVRDGQVRTIRQIIRDRKDGRMREIDAKPGNMSYYGVDGLFLILDEERAQLQDDRPFGQPKGTRAILKFEPDPKLGYPRRYRRDVVGSPKGLALDVIRLVPNPTSAIPPPPA